MFKGETVGQFMGISHDTTRTFKGEIGDLIFKKPIKFRIILYCALNAGGLIGPEFNGIAIIDETNKCVVSRDICKQDSGYFGPSDAQIAKWNEMVNMPDEEFVKLKF